MQLVILILILILRFNDKIIVNYISLEFLPTLTSQGGSIK